VDSLITLSVIAGLIVVNGFFVAAEFALIGAPRASVERRAREGNRVARLLAMLLRDPRRQDQYIATAQLGITFASLGLGMYGEHAVAGWIANWYRSYWPANPFMEHTAASIIALLLLTYFHIVVGEMVPKAMALQSAERTAMWVTPPMSWTRILLYPLVVLLNGIGNAILRLFRIERSAAGHHLYHTAEELELVVQESQAGGALRAESGEVLRELLTFGELSAGEVMTPRTSIAGIPLHAAKQDIAEIVLGSRHSRYPVYEEDLDHIAGCVHIKDLLPILMNGRTLDATDLRPVAFVPQSSGVDSVLAAMRREQTQVAVVMDEYGGTAGMVTTQDLFEEIVGRVPEDATDPEITSEGERLMVAGAVRLEQVGERLGLTLEHEEVDTVSGLVLHILDGPPSVGDRVVYEGLEFEVIEILGHGVRRCAVVRKDA
jgi:CBS domain containing-hemolysin-like protein